MVDDILKYCTYEFCFGNYINLDNRWRCEGKYLTEDHLYCIRSGSAEFTIDGETYLLEAGKSYLFPTNKYISYHCPKAFSLDWFHFRVRIFDTIDLLDHVDCNYELPIGSDDLTRLLYAKLFILDQQEASLEKSLTMPAIIQQLAAPFLSQATINKDGVTFLKLEPALRYIEKHLDIPVRVSELAAECSYEESYFADLFSKTIGVPPAKYIVKRKMEKSKALLSTGLRIDEVSQALGFYDLSHFSKSFKRYTGMSPKVYKDFSQKSVAMPG